MRRPVCGRALALTGALVGVCLGSAHAADFQPLDRVEAVVGARSPGRGVRLVLSSDIELRARLLLLGEGDLDALTRVLPESLREAVRTQLVGEMMLATEAERLSMAKPLARDRDLELARLAASVGGAAALEGAIARLGASPEELLAVLELRATVSGFLDANLEHVQVSDADVEAAHKDPDSAYHALPLVQVRERVRAAIQEERVEQAVASWVNTLTQRIPHRIYED